MLLIWRTGPATIAAAATGDRDVGSVRDARYRGSTDDTGGQEADKRADRAPTLHMGSSTHFGWLYTIARTKERHPMGTKACIIELMWIVSCLACETLVVTGCSERVPVKQDLTGEWGEPNQGLVCSLVSSSRDILTSNPLTFDLVVQNVGTEDLVLSNRIGTRACLYLNGRNVGQEVSLYDKFAFELPADNSFVNLRPGSTLRATFPPQVLETHAFSEIDAQLIDTTAKPGTYLISAVYSQRGAGRYPANWWRGTVRSPTVEVRVRSRPNGDSPGQ